MYELLGVRGTMADLEAKKQRRRLWFTSANPRLTATVKMNTVFQEHAVDSAKGTLTRKMIAPLSCVSWSWLQKGSKVPEEILSLQSEC